MELSYREYLSAKNEIKVEPLRLIKGVYQVYRGNDYIGDVTKITATKWVTEMKGYRIEAKTRKAVVALMLELDFELGMEEPQIDFATKIVEDVEEAEEEVEATQEATEAPEAEEAVVVEPIRKEMLEALETKFTRHGYSWVGNDILEQVKDWIRSHELFEDFPIIRVDAGKRQSKVTIVGFFENRW